MSKTLSIWWRSLRAYSLPMTILPVLCAFLYARVLGDDVRWALFPLMLLSGVLLHAGTNLLNDYYDYTLGFDTDEASGSSGVIQEQLIPAKTLLFRGRLYILFGSLVAIPMVLVRGWPLLLIGMVSLYGAYFYSHPKGYKYKGLGEPAVFLLMGPLLFAAGVHTACGTLPASLLAPACAFGCLVTAVLLVNNIRDEEMDRKAGFVTLPMRIGPSASRQLYLLLLFAALAIPLLLFVTNQLSGWILLPWLSLPLAIRLIHRVFTAKQPALDLKNGPPQTAGFYMAYGVLMAISLTFCG